MPKVKMNSWLLDCPTKWSLCLKFQNETELNGGATVLRMVSLMNRGASFNHPVGDVRPPYTHHVLLPSLFLSHSFIFSLFLLFSLYIYLWNQVFSPNDWRTNGIFLYPLSFSTKHTQWYSGDCSPDLKKKEYGCTA